MLYTWLFCLTSHNTYSESPKQVRVNDTKMGKNVSEFKTIPLPRRSPGDCELPSILKATGECIFGLIYSECPVRAHSDAYYEFFRRESAEFWMDGVHLP